MYTQNKEDGLVAFWGHTENRVKLATSSVSFITLSATITGLNLPQKVKLAPENQSYFFCGTLKVRSAIKINRHLILVTALNQALVDNCYFWKMKRKPLLPDISYKVYSGKKSHSLNQF